MYFDVLKRIWPEWEIGKRIGGGAFGTVYEARRNEYGIENKAAIKIISIPANEAEIDSLHANGLNAQDTKTHFDSLIKDFTKEIQIMFSLQGRNNIVTVQDYKVVKKDNGIGYYIFILMELLTPFPEYANENKLSEKDIIKLGCDICSALEVCAEENIIHRDIKPGNILIQKKSGIFKLGDFGIAKKLENTTGGLSQKFTPKYMAPEKSRRQNYDKSVDIYSLGIVLYELLNDRRIPFQQNRQINSYSDIENAVMQRNAGKSIPPPCNASAAMANVILRACAYNPNERFRSATEMKQALNSVLNGTYQIASLENQTLPANDTSENYQQQYYDNLRHYVEQFDEIHRKKKSFPFGILLIIVALALIAGLLVCIFKLFDSYDNDDDSDKNRNKNSISSEIDNPDDSSEDISSIISEAEALADTGDFEGALDIINNGLDSYPDSEELQIKSEEYTAELDTMIPEEDQSEPEPTTEEEPPVENDEPDNATTSIPVTENKIDISVATTSPPPTAAPAIHDFRSVLKEVYASSQLSSQTYGNQTYAYSPQKTVDNDHSTCWSEGASEYGNGDSITLLFNDVYTIREICIWNGLCTNEDLFNKNSRLRRITITLSDGQSFDFECKDGWDNRKNVFSLPDFFETSSITITIRTVYEGSKYMDTCISEISVS